ncbi:MAG TPA: hypothetical protein VGF91_10160 [Solirubrobacteraceae bacterium]
MKIAWFTPVTGHEPAVEYSREVLHAMAQLCEPLLCSNGAPEGFPTEIPVVDLAAAGSQRRPDPWSVDAVFYMLGNDLQQHAWIFEASQLHPGIVVLQDRTLHTFFLAYYLEHLGRPDLYITRMAHYYGSAGLATAHRVIGPWFDSGDARLEPEDTRRYTFTEEALLGATGAIVDSGGHGTLVRRLWSGPVHEASLRAQDERSAGDRSTLEYAQGLIRFAHGLAASVPVDRLADAESRAVAEQMAMHVGTTLGSLGAKPDSLQVEAVISEAARLLSAATSDQARR